MYKIHEVESNAILMEIILLESAYQRTILMRFQAPIYKKVEYAFFLVVRSRMRVFLFVLCVFFFWGG